MGAPILLGGMEFRIPTASLASFGSEPSGFGILSEFAIALKIGGYDPTKPKRGKVDDVRLRCLHRLGYLDLILIIEPSGGETSAFGLDCWGFTRYHNDAVYEEFNAVWRSISQIVHDLVRDRLNPTAITMLTPAEVDERYGGGRAAKHSDR